MGEFENNYFRSLATLRRGLLDAATDLVCLKHRDVPERCRPDLAEVLAYLDRANLAERLAFLSREKGKIIASIRKLSDEEVLHAFATLCMLGVVTGALRAQVPDGETT